MQIRVMRQSIETAAPETQRGVTGWEWPWKNAIVIKHFSDSAGIFSGICSSFVLTAILTCHYGHEQFKLCNGEFYVFLTIFCPTNKYLRALRVSKFPEQWMHILIYFVTVHCLCI